MELQEETFEQWFNEYKRMLVVKYGWSPVSAESCDAQAFEEFYFNNSLTIEEAYKEECESN